MAHKIPAAIKKQDADADEALADFLQGDGEDDDTSLDDLLKDELETGSEETEESDDSDEGSNELARLQADLDLERQRNASLQGRIESQLKPLNATVKELKARLEKEGGDSGDPSVPAYKKYLKETDSQFGDELLEAAGRTALGVSEAALAKEQQRVAALQERVAQLESRDSEQMDQDLWSRVDQLSPGAAEDNRSNPLWFQFLSQVDSVSGRTYRDLGTAAASAGDIGRLAELHKQFKSRGRGPNTTARVVDREVEEEASSSAVHPETVKAEASRTSPRQKMIKVASVEKFYQDRARGVYEGRDAEAKKIEAEIDRAYAEGRIV